MCDDSRLDSNDTYLKNFSIIHRFSIMYHLRSMKEFNISGHQMGYIMHIYKNPGVSQEDLASYLRLNKGSVAKGIRSLMQDGYIRRVQNQHDRRAYCLYPTDKAKQIVSQVELELHRFNEILTDGMTKEEKRLFIELLNKACRNVLNAAGDARHELSQPGPPPGCRRPPHCL